MRLPLFVSTVLVVSVISSVCTAMVCLQLSPRTATSPTSAPAPGPTPNASASTPAMVAPAPRPRPQPSAPRTELAQLQPAPPAEPATIPAPPPALDEAIPPPPEAPAQLAGGRLPGPAPAPAPAAGPTAAGEVDPASGDSTPIYVQHEVDDAIYRDYYGCSQAEVVVINTCQRCYQFNHADVLAVCLVARWAGIPLSVAFRTFYDDDHCSLQALLAGYHLDPGIFFIALPADLACPGPYQRPYLLFRTMRSGESAYSNDEYRALIALKIACDFQGRQPMQFFAAVQHGDTPLQAVYRSPGAAPALPAHRWSGSALQPPGAAAASAHQPTAAGTPASATARLPGEVESAAMPHAGAPHGSALRLDQPARGEAREHAPPPFADGARAGTRPAAPPSERRTADAPNERGAQGQTSHDAPGAAAQAQGAGQHLHAEPSDAAPGYGVQAAGSAGGQAAAAGAAPGARR